MAADDEDALKRRFAAELYRTDRNAWIAAMAVSPHDYQRACFISTAWLADPIVIEELNKHTDRKLTGELADREDLARELWAIGTGLVAVKVETRDRLTALDQYAKIMGYNPTPGQSASYGGVAAGPPRVLEVPQFGSFEEWEEKARRQQAALIAAARGEAPPPDPATATVTNATRH